MLDTMFSEDDFVFKKELNSLLDKLLFYTIREYGYKINLITI